MTIYTLTNAHILRAPVSADPHYSLHLIYLWSPLTYHHLKRLSLLAHNMMEHGIMDYARN